MLSYIDKIFFMLYNKLNYKSRCNMEYNIGDIIETKKNHPCGCNKWELTRVGIDFKLKCLKCEHCITLERQKALKIIKKVKS